MTPEQVGQIFQPFVQVHDTMAVSDPGAGLGLYIAKAIVVLHGGEIRAESGGTGKGARFTVRLPLGPNKPAVADNAIPGPPDAGA